MESQRKLILDFRDLLEITPAEFDRLVRPIIANLGAVVHLLPASERHHHRAAGGLFHHSLDVAYRAAKLCKTRIFETTATPQARNRLEPRWRVAVGIAGLLHDGAKPLTDVTITDRSGDVTWIPCETLYDWAHGHGIDRYFPRYRAGRKRQHEVLTSAIFDLVLNAEFKSWLFQFGDGPAMALYGTLSGANGDNVVAHLVAQADRASVADDLKRQGATVESVHLAVPAHAYLIDAMKRLHADGKWTVNDGGVLWYLADGLYVVWERAARDVLEVLRQDQIPGIPSSADLLADILIERGMAVARLLPDGMMFRYHLVLPQMLRGRGLQRPIPMLKLAAGDDFFQRRAPAWVPATVGLEADELMDGITAGVVDLSGDPTALFMAQGEPAGTTSAVRSTKREGMTERADEEGAPRTQSGVEPRAARTAPPPATVVDRKDMPSDLSQPARPSSAVEPPSLDDAALSAALDRIDEHDFGAASAPIGRPGPGIEVAKAGKDVAGRRPPSDPADNPAPQLAEIRTLEAYGTPGILLIRATQAVVAGRIAASELLLRLSDERLGLRHPQALEWMLDAGRDIVGPSKTGPLLAQFEAAGMVEPHPDDPKRCVQKVGGASVILLKGPVLLAVSSLLAGVGSGVPALSKEDRKLLAGYLDAVGDLIETRGGRRIVPLSSMTTFAHHEGVSLMRLKSILGAVGGQLTNSEVTLPEEVSRG